MEECMEIGGSGSVKAGAVRIMSWLLAVVLICSAIQGGTPLNLTTSVMEGDSLVMKTTGENADSEGDQELGRTDIMSDMEIPTDPVIVAAEEQGIASESVLEAGLSVEIIPDISTAVGSTEETQDVALASPSDKELTDESEMKMINLPDETGTNEIVLNPSESLVEEIPEEPTQEVLAAETEFVIDEDGMICGFRPEYSDIVDGALLLPKEGCTGIRCGAFSGGGAGITELYIPATISVIEEGAFYGLDSLEWIEAEAGNPGCCSVDGVLFNETLTVLLAFTNGRNGSYLVPETVTRIGDRAFLNTSITALDLRSCGDVTFGNDVFGNSSDMVELLMP